MQQTLGRDCSDDQLQPLMISWGLCKVVDSVFDVDVRTMGAGHVSNVIVTLDPESATVSDVKLQLEWKLGVSLGQQELMMMRGGARGNAFLPNGELLRGRCVLMLYIVAAKEIVIEGLPAGHPQSAIMGMFERVQGLELNGRGVWMHKSRLHTYMFFANSDKGAH